MNDAQLPSAVASQIDYHLRAAITRAVEHGDDTSASEAALALALFHSVASELIEPVTDLPSLRLPQADRDNLLRTSRALALQLQSHFTSEGRHDLAAVYESTAAGIPGALPES